MTSNNALPAIGYLKERKGRAYEELAPVPRQSSTSITTTIKEEEIVLIQETEGEGYLNSSKRTELPQPPTQIPAPQQQSNISSRSIQLSRSGEWTRDWNFEYQMLADKEDSETKFTQLAKLAHDFVFTALQYGQIIISELCVPSEHKTVKTVNVGGIAGGEKFCAQNILFKKLTDAMVNEHTWLYGGKIRNDTFALKSGLHELKGVMSWISASHGNKLHFPLMAVIDYLGFRLLAISVLPIDHETLINGSSDGGITMKSSNDEFISLVEKAANSLNLKPHIAGSTSKSQIKTSAPGDLEGHLGNDKRFYILDFSRTLPPEFPIKDESRSVYYKLLRPEFVRRWKNKLCSDAMTNWQCFDPEAEQNNSEIEEASIMIKEDLIPQLAEKLDSMTSGKDTSSSKLAFYKHRAKFALQFARIHGKEVSPRELESLNIREKESTSSFGDFPIVTPKMIISEMHRMGINVRFLGLVHHHVKSKYLQGIILMEMAARIIKNHIREELRAKMQQIRTLGEEPFKEVVLSILSLTVGAKRSPTFWQKVQSELFNYFHPPNDFNYIMEEIDQRELVKRIQELADIRLENAANQAIMENPSVFEFVDSDISQLLPRVRHLNVIDFSEGMSLCLAAQRKSGREKMRLLKLSEARLESAISSYPDNFIALYNIGKTLSLEAAEVDSTVGINMLRTAIKKLELSVQLKDDFDESQFLLGIISARLGCLEPKETIVRKLFYSSINHLQTAISLKPQLAKEMEPFCLQLHNTYGKKAQVAVLEGLALLFRGMHDIINRTNFGTTIEEKKIICGNLLFLCGDIALKRVKIAKNAQKEHELFLLAFRRFSSALTLNQQLIPKIIDIGDELTSSRNRVKLYASLLGASIIYSSVLNIRPNDTELIMKSTKALLMHGINCETTPNPYFSEAAQLLETLSKQNKMAAVEFISNALIEQQSTLTTLLQIIAESPSMKQLFIECWGNVNDQNKKIQISSCKDFGINELSQLCNVCPNLISLDISHCASLGEETLSILLTQLPILEELCVDGCHKLSFQPFEDKLISSNSLRSLSVSECSISDNAVIGLSSCCKKLQSLDLSKCSKITSSALNSPNGGPSQLPNLISISLYSCLKVEIVGFMSLISKCTNLRHLNIGGCSKVDDSVLRLLGLRLQNLESLNLDSCTKITDEGIISMLTALSSRNSPKLFSLNMRGCRLITDNSINAIAELVPSTMKNINISRLPLLTNQICVPLSKLENLQSLRIPGTAVLMTPSELYSLISTVNLAKLDLSQCTGATDEILEFLLSKFTNLKSLHLRLCSSIESFEFPSLSKHSRSLISLDVSATAITDKSMQFIAHTLRKLEKLNVNGCTKLSNSISEIASKQIHLKRLDIGNCSHVTDSAAVKIAECLQNLERLTMDSCLMISPKTLTLIVQRLVKLTHLSLKDCKNVDDKVVQHMAICLHKLRSVNLVGCGGLTEKPLADLKKKTCLERAALSLEAKGVVNEIETTGFGRKLAKIPEEQLKWLRRSREMRERQQEIKELSTLPPSTTTTSHTTKQHEQEIIPPSYLPFTTKIPLAVLITHPPDCDPCNLEKYLTEEECTNVLGAHFMSLPKWKQDQIKREHNIF